MCNYLLNLATLDPAIREKSDRVVSRRTGSRRDDRRRVSGAASWKFKGQSLEQGIAAFVLGLAEAAQGFRAPGLTVLLENTVGSGSQIGRRFEELRMIRDLAARETDLAARILPRYLPSAGVRLRCGASRRPQADSRRGGQVLGLDLVRVIHANDSKGALNSHLDRHANIGEGQIGEEGFRRILTHPALRAKPFILETPVDEEGDDRRNVDALKRLSWRAPGSTGLQPAKSAKLNVHPTGPARCPKRRTTTTRSS